MIFKTASSLSVLLALLSPSTCQSKSNEYDHLSKEASNMEEFNLKLEQFHSWKQQVGKSYDSTEEESERLQVWLDNHGTYSLYYYGGTMSTGIKGFFLT